MSLPSPLGPNAHYANHRTDGVVTSRLACRCPIATEHAEDGRPETFVWPDRPTVAPVALSPALRSTLQPLEADEALYDHLEAADAARRRGSWRTWS